MGACELLKCDIYDQTEEVSQILQTTSIAVCFATTWDHDSERRGSVSKYLKQALDTSGTVSNGGTILHAEHLQPCPYNVSHTIEQDTCQRYPTSLQGTCSLEALCSWSTNGCARRMGGTGKGHLTLPTPMWPHILLPTFIVVSSDMTLVLLSSEAAVSWPCVANKFCVRGHPGIRCHAPTPQHKV